jgi:hypothetical protein
MSSRIVEAEYLHYSNPARNSDKVFNIFLVEEDDETFSCISEYGRNGTSLVRVLICSNKSLTIAERAFNQKVEAKRNHRETPYRNSPVGRENSAFAREAFSRALLENQAPTPEVVDSAEMWKQAADSRMKNSRILNQRQIDSLEI